MKECFKCLESKPFSEFYAHPQMGDGYLGKCKECTRKDNRENRKAKSEQYAEYERLRAKTKVRIDYNISHTAQWRKDYPEKYKAHTSVNNAIRDGRLERKPCEVCGAKAHAHHDDYSKPLDVIWLCAKHHKEHHVRFPEIP